MISDIVIKAVSSGSDCVIRRRYQLASQLTDPPLYTDGLITRTTVARVVTGRQRCVKPSDSPLAGTNVWSDLATTAHALLIAQASSIRVVKRYFFVCIFNGNAQTRSPNALQFRSSVDHIKLQRMFYFSQDPTTTVL